MSMEPLEQVAPSAREVYSNYKYAADVFYAHDTLVHPRTIREAIKGFVVMHLLPPDPHWASDYDFASHQFNEARAASAQDLNEHYEARVQEAVHDARIEGHRIFL